MSGPRFWAALVCLGVSLALRPVAVAAGERAPRERTAEFGGVSGFRLLETEHFRIYHQGSPEPARGTAERVWRHVAAVVPGFADRWLAAEGSAGEPETRAADGGDQEDGPPPARLRRRGGGFKLPLYLVDNARDYRTICDWDVATHAEGEAAEAWRKVLERIASFTVQDGRAFVLHRGAEGLREPRPSAAYFSHMVTQCLLKRHLGRAQLPLWFIAGFGYETEFSLFRMTATHYVDYAAYGPDRYPAAGGEPQAWVNEAATFGAGVNWAGIIKRLMAARGGAGDLRSVIRVTQVADMSPETCGYGYSLFCYLLADRDRIRRFGDFLERVETAGEFREEDLLAAYGADSLETLEAEWHRFLRSAEFR